MHFKPDILRQNPQFWDTPKIGPPNWARGKIPAPLGYWKLQFMDEIILIDRISTDYLISTPFSGHQENNQQLNKGSANPTTPPKFNMEPENKSMEKESPFGNHDLQVPC